MSIVRTYFIQTLYVARTTDDELVSIQRRLNSALADASPPRLRAALLTAVSGTAARVRPLLCLVVARAACGGDAPELAWAAAVAVEMIHCASLAHDDLPCFDDASERRGRPSLHCLFGEPMALLAGDALIVAAFAHLARAGAPSSFITELAQAAGAERGLVSGQAFELETVADVSAYHAAKTGSLFEVAARLGAAAVRVADQPFAQMGRRLGDVYQVADDLADVFGDPVKLGKPIHQDVTHRRPSVCSGLDYREALALFDARVCELMDVVPACPDEAQLRAFLRQVSQRLRERLRP